MLMVMYTRENGKTTKPMDTVDTSTLMVPCMKVCGRKISSMVMARRHGLMVLSTREIMWRARRTAQANSCGQTGPPMRDSSKIITSMEGECIFGLIREGIRECGSIIKCMEKEYSLGLMAESMKETTLMIRNKEKVSSHGLMVVNTMVIG
jgi:hypothetical protein